MLDASHDEMAATMLAGSSYAPDRQVDGLGARAGEDDIVGFTAQEPGDAPPRDLDLSLLGTCASVQPAGTHPLVGQVGTHGVPHLGRQWRGGGVIEIDWRSPHDGPS